MAEDGERGPVIPPLSREVLAERRRCARLVEDYVRWRPDYVSREEGMRLVEKIKGGKR